MKRKLTKEEMKNIVTGGMSLSTSGTYKRINNLILNGSITRVSKGVYVCEKKHSYSYEFRYDISKKVLSTILKRFDKSLIFDIYEVTILNEFLNHLLATNTTIVEVEKDLIDSVFWWLKESGFKHVLLNPNSDENYLYNALDSETIIIKPLVSKSPIDNKNHKITIEKLIVDVVQDRTLNMFFESAEIPWVLEQMFGNYSVKYDTVRNYAKRRHCFDVLLSYIPEDVKALLND